VQPSSHDQRAAIRRERAAIAVGSAGRPLRRAASSLQARRRSMRSRELRRSASGVVAAQRVQCDRGMSDRDRALVIYDGDCGLCQKVIDLLSRSPRGRRLEWRASSSLTTLPAGLTEVETDQAAWLVVAGRAPAGGFDAFRHLSLRLPLLWLLVPLFWFPGARLVGGPLYRVVAARRRRISQRLGLTACTIRPIGRRK
jgi:predicted DCC family thiol-disulfide oxidoreductase YuxK